MYVNPPAVKHFRLAFFFTPNFFSALSRLSLALSRCSVSDFFSTVTLAKGTQYLSTITFKLSKSELMLYHVHSHTLKQVGTRERRHEGVVSARVYTSTNMFARATLAVIRTVHRKLIELEDGKYQLVM